MREPQNSRPFSLSGLSRLGPPWRAPRAFVSSAMRRPFLATIVHPNLSPLNSVRGPLDLSVIHLSTLRGKIRKKSRDHFRGEILEDTNGSGDKTVSQMAYRQVKYLEMPPRHHFDEPPRAQQLGLH